MRRHSIETSSRRIPSLKYRGNRREIEIKMRMISAHGSTSFSASVPEYGINESGKDVDELYRKVCGLLDEATSIEWKPFLAIEVDNGTKIEFDDPAHVRANEAEFQIYCAIQVEQIEIGTRPDGAQFHRRPGSGYIRDGRPNTGADLRSHSVFGLDLDTQDAIVPDTPENRAAFEKLAADFNRLNERLRLILSQEQAERTLAAAASIGLLGSGSAEGSDAHENSQAAGAAGGSDAAPQRARAGRTRSGDRAQPRRRK